MRLQSRTCATRDIWKFSRNCMSLKATISWPALNLSLWNNFLSQLRSAIIHFLCVLWYSVLFTLYSAGLTRVVLHTNNKFIRKLKTSLWNLKVNYLESIEISNCMHFICEMLVEGTRKNLVLFTSKLVA